MVHDRYWARELHSAVLCGALLLGMPVLLDWGLADLTAVRLMWWAALGALLSIILTPPRVSAVDGGLDARGLRSLERGTLRRGMPVLERLGRRIDRASCRAILRTSGLE